MNILNQSIAPHGSNSQDIFPMAPSLYKSLFMKLIPLKKNPLVTSSEQSESLCKNESINGGVCKLSQLFGKRDYFDPIITWPTDQRNSTELEPWTSSFLSSVMETEKLNLIKKENALAVFVSSAVKLERRQLNQIAKKMQKVTGSRNVTLENTIDPSLIAGFIITYEKEEDVQCVIDLSVKGELAQLTARIENTD
ncbi:hypothetical protein GIB67_029263 [Kingdonia uniflora]|uniref:Uncharacterized protein n=1 Tax=Kingdonia uniflora TaxID=39325 RepID=A0A7J7N8Q4_9MAGN|nr:hypothetical protein GIB67_029263 [Kingdonia uniflora]